MDQHLIADRMAMDVVDLLEAVQVDHHDRMRLRRSRHLLQCAGERLVELAAVGQAGQGILEGQDKNLPLRLEPPRVFPLMLAGAPPRVAEDGEHKDRRQNEKLIQLDGLFLERHRAFIFEHIDLEHEQRRHPQQHENEAEVENFGSMLRHDAAGPGRQAGPCSCFCRSGHPASCASAG